MTGRRGFLASLFALPALPTLTIKDGYVDGQTFRDCHVVATGQSTIANCVFDGATLKLDGGACIGSSFYAKTKT